MSPEYLWAKFLVLFKNCEDRTTKGDWNDPDLGEQARRKARRARKKAGNNIRGDIKLTFLTNELTQGVEMPLAGRLVDLINERSIDFAEASRMIKQAKTAALLKEVMCEALERKTYLECMEEFPDLLTQERFSLTL